MTRNARLPRGVTLIELLIAILIISILAAAVLGVAAVAGETAREAKTRNMVARLHTLLTEHYESYTTRRVKLRPEVITEINKQNTNSAVRGRLTAEARLYALRELILMEIPDRWSDVLLREVPDPPNGSAAETYPPLYLDAPVVRDQSFAPARRTELANIYLRNYRRLAVTTNKLTGSTNTAEEIRRNQGAECLYMVVMNACGDGEARTLFGESSIGDADGDGAPEFVDGWGHPINFLRWAPGFESDIQYNANELDNPPTGTVQAAWADAGNADHEPFDLFRTAPTAYRLVPLIYSPGRDEDSGLNSAPDFVTWRRDTMNLPSFETNLSQSAPYVTPALNPYLGNVSGVLDDYLGTPDAADKTATDNITNHLIETRVR